jgi:hypothetical protein
MPTTVHAIAPGKPDLKAWAEDLRQSRDRWRYLALQRSADGDQAELKKGWFK